MGARDEKPMVSVSLNLDEIMLETVGLIRSARTQFESISGAVGDHLNVSMDSTVNDVVHIVENVREITGNLAQTTSTFYQPIFYIILMLILTLIFLVVLLLVALRTRLEYKKRPIKFLRRRFGKAAGGRVNPRDRRSTSGDGETLEAGSEVKYPPKKGNDTLV